MVYLWVVGLSGSSGALLASRTRVAPMKPIMIPRLGLLSVLLLARLLNTVDSFLRKDLDFEQPVCFTDSKIALA